MIQVSYLLKKLVMEYKVIFLIQMIMQFWCQCYQRIIHFENRKSAHDLVMDNQAMEVLKI